MQLILLSGGSGKRLWPLSNNARSKQFLKVLPSTCDTYESMVQRVWRQIEESGVAKSAVIATSISQVDMIHSQLGDHIDLVIEPERRDTFPAIALACTYLKNVKECNDDEVIVVLPVDPYVELEYFNTIHKLEHIIQSGGTEIALVGVQPTYPSEKYGYIIPDDRDVDRSFVSQFKEKPTEQEAQALMESGALWNCGVFAFKLSFMMDIIKTHVEFDTYDQLRAEYGKLKATSFDYEVVEKSKNIQVVRYKGFWKDLGTWNTLCEHMSGHTMGKVNVADTCVNTHVLNELDIPVVVMGINYAVVVVSNDGILICDKAESGKLKDFIGHYDQRPMYEERRWGWYKVLDYASFADGNNTLTKRLMLKAGKNLSYQFHRQRQEVWTILSGCGELILNDELYEAKAGDVVSIPRGMKHALKATVDVELIEVQSGDSLVEEDIVRFAYVWEEILSQIQRQVVI